MLMRERELLKKERRGERRRKGAGRVREGQKEGEREREERETYLTPPSNVSDTLLASHVSDTALGCMIIN